MLQIGFPSIRKEDNLLVSLLNNIIFLPIECFLFGSKRNVSIMSQHGHIQLNCDLSSSEGTTKRVFQTKNECCLRSGDIKKGFLLDCSDKLDKIVPCSI